MGEMTKERMNELIESMDTPEPEDETRTVRLNLTQPKYVVDGMKAYASRKNRHLSELVREWFFKALEEE